MTTPNRIRAFELRLRANWSSEDVVQMLTPEYVESVLLLGFAALEPTIKMRALIAFLGARVEHLASLRHVLPALLRVADCDKDEWVQVVSGLVRQKILPSEGGDSANAGRDAATTQTGFVLRKTVREVLERAKQNMSERAGSGERAAGSDGGSESRQMWEAPYFGPLEERYVSLRQQPRKQDFVNADFSVKYDFISEFSEDVVSTGGGASNTSSSPTGGSASAAAAALASRTGQGGLLKAPGSSVSQPTPTAPNLAQARRVSLAAAVDPSAGSDGLRRTSKPLALSRNHVGFQPGAARGTSGVGSVRGVRGGGGGGKAGLMMINVDELQAIHAEKQSAREKAKGKPGRKKAKVDGGDEQQAADTEPSVEAVVTGEQQSNQSTTDADNADRRHMEKASGEERKAAESNKAPVKPSAPTDGPMPIPQQGEIEAVAAMMVLGVAGGSEDAKTSYLPEALTTLLENANSLRPEGKAKLESFFQKQTPQGSPQERVKYHEDVSPGADGEMMRVTSYIRLDYETWVWDRVHKKKRVKP